MIKSQENNNNNKRFRLTLAVVSAIYCFYNRIVSHRRIIIWDFMYSMLSGRSMRIGDECP